MYRCSLCDHQSEPGQPRLLHVIHRTVQDRGPHRLEIARELPVCPRCKARLNAGEPLSRLLARARQAAPVLPAAAAPAAPTVPVMKPFSFYRNDLKQKGN